MTCRDEYKRRIESDILIHVDEQQKSAMFIANAAGLPVQCVGHVLRRLVLRGVVIERIRRDTHPSRWGGEKRRYYSINRDINSGAWWDLRPK